MSTFREFMLEVGCVLDWHLVFCMHCPEVKGFSPGLINNDKNAVIVINELAILFPIDTSVCTIDLCC